MRAVRGVASARLVDDTGQIEPQRVGDPERLGDLKRPVDELVARAQQLDLDQVAGERRERQKSLQSRHTTSGDQHMLGGCPDRSSPHAPP